MKVIGMAAGEGLEKVFRLAYVSEPCQGFGKKELDQIREVSTLRNAELDVTGLLVILENCILQVLEGQKEEVESLFALISEDSRHQRVKQFCGSFGSRRFLNTWSMVGGMTTYCPERLRVQFRKVFERARVSEEFFALESGEVDVFKEMSLISVLPFEGA